MNKIEHIERKRMMTKLKTTSVAKCEKPVFTIFFISGNLSAAAAAAYTVPIRINLIWVNHFTVWMSFFVCLQRKYRRWLRPLELFRLSLSLKMLLLVVEFFEHKKANKKRLSVLRRSVENSLNSRWQGISKQLTCLSNGEAKCFYS